MPEKVLPKKQFLSTCERITRTLPLQTWRDLEENEIVLVQRAWAVLHRVLYGEKTLPDPHTEAGESIEEEGLCK